MRLLACFTILFLLGDTGFCQKFLALEKYGRTKRIIFNIGQEVTYKNIEEEFERTDQLTDLVYEDSIVVFSTDSMKLGHFEYIRKPPKKGLFTPENGLKVVIAGLAYFLIDQFNHSVLGGNQWRIDDNVLRTSAIITGVGVLWYFLKNPKFRPGGNRRIRIVDMTPGG